MIMAVNIKSQYCHGNGIGYHVLSLYILHDFMIMAVNIKS